MSYQLVEDLQEKAITVSQACRVLDVSRSGYYAAAKRRQAAPVLCTESAHVKAAFTASGRTYGSRRTRTALCSQGVTMGRHRVRSLMRANGLRPVWRRKFVHTTDSKHTMPVSNNVLARQFERPLPNQAWVCDITYIRTRSGWLYLAAVLDLHSRKIVGWAMAPQMPATLVCAALQNGYRSAQSQCGSHCPFRPGDAIRQCRASSAIEKTRPGWQHERQRQLLGGLGVLPQCRHGALLSELEDGAGLAKGLRQPQ